MQPVIVWLNLGGRYIRRFISLADCNRYIRFYGGWGFLRLQYGSIFIERDDDSRIMLRNHGRWI